MVNLCLIFRGTAILLSTMAAPFYIPIGGAQGFQFLYLFITLVVFWVLFCFSLIANLIGVLWSLIVILHFPNG